jgi:hypothetical protein
MLCLTLSVSSFITSCELTHIISVVTILTAEQEDKHLFNQYINILLQLDGWLTMNT